ncbi:hypothetical protein [Desulfosarcina ovata]|uniref:hypothetical protein n=1 Tax=Desulfosarcina ovata TaxID=83564 RepID=UPI0012D32874|nr:hypothetical protein [Desulfosarcina ovata]
MTSEKWNWAGIGGIWRDLAGFGGDTGGLWMAWGGFWCENLCRENLADSGLVRVFFAFKTRKLSLQICTLNQKFGGWYFLHIK